MRSHRCTQLSEGLVGETVRICGWVHSRRDHGGVIFLDVRDSSGLVQVVYEPENTAIFAIAEKLRHEFVIQVEGHVRLRPAGMINDKMQTGQVEVLGDKLVILNQSQVPPFLPDEHQTVNEDIRYRYRYLDLRRDGMQHNLTLRHNLVRTIRDYLNNQDFIDIETPMLTKATPEGARDYLVPSRVHPGNFYALPQSPQIYKQILMIAGYDRYYQFARCLRDEDLRADRQPEHTQVDLEMSFAAPDDIFELTEGMVKHVFRVMLNKDVKTPFKRFSYNESMER